MSISTANLSSGSPLPMQSAPAAIQACVASLAAEAFDAGHDRAAQVLAHAAALLMQSDLWNRTLNKP